MTTATVSTDFRTDETAGRTTLLRPGLGAGVAAGVATTAFAAGVHAAGVPLEIAGESIPLVGFGQLTVMLTVVGLVIATGLRRFTRHAQTAWIRTSVALAVLSFVPDLTADATLATKLALMATHVIAAVIVIPVVARRLSD